MHRFETIIRLQHTDAAGVVFFARFFELAHLAFEDLLDALGNPLPQDLAGAALILPIIHAQSDYRAALRMGDHLRIDVTVDVVRSRSFTLGYVFTKSDDSNPEGREVAQLRTVHAAVDTTSGKATALPETLARALGVSSRTRQ